jgi:hypothetical protein
MPCSRVVADDDANSVRVEIIETPNPSQEEVTSQPEPAPSPGLPIKIEPMVFLVLCD